METRIAGKHVQQPEDWNSGTLVDGQALVYRAKDDMWVACEAQDLPIEVDGITATTLGGALAELLAAIP